MRSSTDHIEKDRIFGSRSLGFNGAFAFLLQRKGHPDAFLRVVCSNGHGWDGAGMRPPAFEHVSVSCVDRCPTWEEMVWIKDLFWASHECVLQYHPPKDQYVNHHPFCLHLWRPIGVEIPVPPKECLV